MVALRRKYFIGPVEVTSFVFLVLFKGRGPKICPRFHLFVSDFNQGNEEKR